jgi:hypothetical protein
MKWLILVLVVINAAYLALHLTAHPAAHEAHQAHTPLHADRIVLLPPGSVRPAPAAADNSADSSAAATADNSPE